MKMKFLIMALIVVIIALFNLSCVTIHTGRPVTYDDILKMSPFDATIESVEVSHPFFLYSAVDIWLKKTDGGERLDWSVCPANKYFVGFARSLHKGQSYFFPQVFADYEKSQQTNAVNMVRH
jgi:hypothetical protein